MCYLYSWPTLFKMRPTSRLKTCLRHWIPAISNIACIIQLVLLSALFRFYFVDICAVFKICLIYEECTIWKLLYRHPLWKYVLISVISSHMNWDRHSSLSVHLLCLVFGKCPFLVLPQTFAVMTIFLGFLRGFGHDRFFPKPSQFFSPTVDAICKCKILTSS